MSKTQSTHYHVLPLACSIFLNIFLVCSLYINCAGDGDGLWWKRGLSWTKRAAEEAEAVAAISCSGHGRAYLDGLVVDGRPVCECNSCYGGPDCSQFLPSCTVNVDGGDPLFLEPFWKQHAESSAVVVAGWHRMSYDYADQTTMSKELEKQIRQLHAIVGNAVTQGRFIIYGAGSTQLLNAAVHAYSLDHININSSASTSPARVVASIPFYALYEQQTELFKSMKFQFEGDASLWKNRTDYTDGNYMIEFVTAPNNPDGQLNQAVLHGQNAKAIHDLAYYWPHFTAIPAPADNEISTFTLSKLTGHASSRFGWAVIKDKTIFERMTSYLRVNTMGVSRDTQLRTLKLLKVLTEGRARELFEFGHATMSKRWNKLSKSLSFSKRFSLQKIVPQYCVFFHKVKEASPAYAWVKCETEEDKNCYDVLLAANIRGRKGSKFFADERYVRLSLIRSQDDFDLMIQKLNKLVSEEESLKTM